MENHVLYSVIVPVYNSERTIEILFERIKNLFNSSSIAFEVIFVEDCGRDNSWKVIEGLYKKNKGTNVKAIKQNKNFGQHNAILCGLHHASGDFIITIDDDLQIPPEEMMKLIEKQRTSQAELVYGVFSEKKHSLFRNLGSEIVQRVFSYVFKTNGNITSFRLFTRNLCNQIKNHDQSFVFIDGLLHWHTQYIERVEVIHLERTIGRSNYNFSKLFKLSSNLIFNFTTLPLQLLVYFGLIVSIVSFLFGSYFIFRKILYDVPIGYTSIIVSIFFSSGILLLVLGMIGEYIIRIFSNLNYKPQYSIRYKLMEDEQYKSRSNTYR